jgi:hypothetical protein
VSCPYFFPIAPRPETEWFRPPRSPLGILHHGACHATPEHAAVDAVCCNFGYARGACPRFPDAAEIDAVRFAQTPSGLICILEKDHRPVRQVAVVELTDPALQAQAEAYRQSHTGEHA